MRQEYALAGLFVGLVLLAGVTAVSLILTLRDDVFDPLRDFTLTVTQPQIARGELVPIHVKYCNDDDQPIDVVGQTLFGPPAAPSPSPGASPVPTGAPQQGVFRGIDASFTIPKGCTEVDSAIPLPEAVGPGHWGITSTIQSLTTRGNSETQLISSSSNSFEVTP